MKYELVHDDTIEFNGRTLTRIRALRNIKQHNIQAGDLGGYVKDGHELSQFNDAWVHDGFMLFDGALLHLCALEFQAMISRSLENVKHYVPSLMLRRAEVDEINAMVRELSKFIATAIEMRKNRGVKK